MERIVSCSPILYDQLQSVTILIILAIGFSPFCSAAVISSNIKNFTAGQCLSTGIDDILTVDCDANDSGQKWIHDSNTRALINNKGLCVDAPISHSLVMLTNCSDNLSQDWSYDEANGSYTNAANGECLDAWGGVPDTRIGVWTCVDNPRQQFENIDTVQMDVDLRFDSYRIKNFAANQCLRTGLNNYIRTVTCDSNDSAQKWNYDSTIGALSNSQGLCVDAPNSRSLVTLTNCSDSPSQDWSYDKAGRIYTNVANGECLDAWGGKPDTRIGVWTCVDKYRQEFENIDTSWEEMELHFNGEPVTIDERTKRLFLTLAEGYSSSRPWTVYTTYDPSSPYTLKSQGKTLSNESTNILYQVAYGKSITINRFIDGIFDDRYTLVFRDPNAYQPPKQWNILMLSVDDLNTWTGHLGTHPNSKTPNLDKLAAAGLSFRHAYALAPACNPSRTALFTGVRPDTSGVTQNEDEYLPVLRTYETIPEYLRRHGYTTLATGKLFHEYTVNPEFFDTYYTEQGQYGSPVRLNGIDALSDIFDWGTLDVVDDTTPDFDKANWAAQQLQGVLQEPFFMGVGIYRPHLPWYVPPDYFDLFPLNEVELPPGVFDW